MMRRLGMSGPFEASSDRAIANPLCEECTGRRSLSRGAWSARLAALVGTLSVAGALSGCVLVDDSGPSNTESTLLIGESRLTADQIQSEVLTFADTYAGLISQGFDSILVQTKDPTIRLIAADTRLNYVTNAVQIAASRNPVTSLLDMTVMVTLQREVWEEYWVPTHFPDGGGAPVTTKLREAEREVWFIAERVLESDQSEALRALVADIRQRYAGQVYVSEIRASDFAEARQDSVVRVRGGRSLLSLFGVDPMAKLSPATRELAESRLLGERAFFLAARMPTLARWHAEVLLLRVAADQDTRRVLAAVDEAGRASGQLADVAGDLEETVRRERTEAIDQFYDRLSVEREAAIGQMFDRVSTERDATLDRLSEENKALRETIVELRTTVEASNALGASVTTALEEANRLTLGIERLKNPDARPFDVTEIESAVRTATEGVRELQTLLVTLNGVLDDVSAAEGPNALRVALDESATRLDGTLDRAFRLGLVLIAASGLSLCLGLAGGLTVARLLAPRRSRTGASS